MADIIVNITDQEAHELMDKAATFITERRMGSAAIMLIESIRPLHFIASQILYMIAPFAELIFKPKEYQKFACALENDEYIRYLLDRIDELDTEFHYRMKEERRALKALKKKKKTLKKLR